MTMGEMDARRALPFLLLVVCAISTVSSFRNGRGGPNFIRHTRRINLNEYLVPPPLPKFPSPGRTGRLTIPRPTEAPGYFAQLMGWLNPFGFGSSAQPSSPPPHREAPYPPSSTFLQSPPPPPGLPAQTYGGPPPPVYDRPPLPLPSHNNHPEYFPAAKTKNCNPCNKVPWMPMQHGESFHSGGDASFVPPPSSQLPSQNGYLPPSNHEVPHDAHHAASQEVRAPDFSYVAPLPVTGQNNGPPLIGPLPNPHLYPGAIPPLFKAKDFNYPVQSNSDGNPGYINVPFPSVPGSGPPTANDSSLGVVEPSFNSGYNGQSGSVYPGISGHSGAIYPGSGYNNPGAGNEQFEHLGVQNHAVQGDLSSSGTQVSHGHTNFVPGKPEFEDTTIHSVLLDPVNQQASFTPNVNHQHSGVSNNGGFYITGPNGPLGDLNNPSQVNQNPPSYGISGLSQAPSNFEHSYNDLSSSGSVVEKSHAPLRTTDESSTKIENPIHFEQSPLLDLTHKGESRTDSSSISPIVSNVFLDFEESAETEVTTSTPGNEIFGTRLNIAPTESHFSTHFQTINPVKSSKELKISDSAAQDSDKSLHDSNNFRSKDITYIPPSGQPEILWSSVLSTTPKSVERESFLSTLVKSYDGVGEGRPNQSAYINSKDINKASEKPQGAKRNKQVQVIIPYTSQYTPLPFHPQNKRNQERKIFYTGQSSQDNLSQESRDKIKVAHSLDSSRIAETLSPTTSSTFISNRGLVIAKTNNSIDVHRLQKNIDNWTIQEYSKGTTASTVSPSSYLFPSKQIPDEYLTTTEPVDQIDGSHEDNVKTFTLAGFSFNDLEHEGSASNRIEGTSIKITRIKESKSTESSTDIPTTTAKGNMWQDFPVAISPVDKERVYVVTPQPIITTPKSNLIEHKKTKAAKEVDRNLKELRKSSETDTKNPNKFESIEKAYQVLPQAVNNLAVASTGPESVPLWGIMEHEEFSLLDDSENEEEDNQPSEIPVLYTGHSKVSRAKR